VGKLMNKFISVYEKSEEMQIGGGKKATFKISDFFSFKVLFNKEHIDNITFYKIYLKKYFQ
jgi:hypothetical protein